MNNILESLVFVAMRFSNQVVGKQVTMQPNQTQTHIHTYTHDTQYQRVNQQKKNEKKKQSCYIRMGA